MANSAGLRFLRHFKKIRDPRSEPKTTHSFQLILFIAVAAVLCGADSWVAIEVWGKSKKKWISQFFNLDAGIPSHDTFRRVFTIINPREFERALSDWTKVIARLSSNRIVCFDGKSLRGSRKKQSGIGALHLVSAWSAVNRVVLGQVRVSDKSNEITAIPVLLDLLRLGSCIVTIDAMGTQKKIVKKILSHGSDYVLSVKENQPTLYRSIKASFEEWTAANFNCGPIFHSKQEESGHGRDEIREYWIVPIDSKSEALKGWDKIATVAKVTSTRTVNGKTSVESRYFISSVTDLQRVAEAIRQHWGIENNYHWCLDVAFDEDKCQIRDRDEAENFAILRRIAMTMLQGDTETKAGLKVRRQKAGWDTEFLERLLGLEPA